MPVPVAAILSLLTHIGGPLMAVAQPEPGPVRISIADDVARVSDGQSVRYQVTVVNATSQEAAVTVKLTLSAVTGLRAENAAVIANAVAWKNSLPAGGSQTYSVAGVVDSGSSEADLAATACVHLAADQAAVSCATDLNALADASRSSERRYAWVAAVLLGLLAAVGAVWLQRRITPELLTPENAGAALGLDPQPAGGLGSREAGQLGSRDAGQLGSREAGQLGPRDAGQPGGAPSV